MTGLESILTQIQEEAGQQAQKIKKEAEEKVQQLLHKAHQQAQEILESAHEKEKMEAAEMEKRAQSAAMLAAKQTVLQEKQRLIGQTLSKAKEALLALSNQEYAALLSRMLQRYVQPGAGEILFSQRDHKRLREEWKKQLAKTYPALQISKEAAPICGGFLLRYGGIEINCDFDAIFEEVQEDMQDRTQTLLFD